MKPIHSGKVSAALRASVLAFTIAASPAMAQPGWGGYGGGWGGMGGYGGGFGGASRYQAPRDDREGRVDAERFLADGAIPALGHGRITLRTMPGTTASDREQATFEAAVVDQLAKAGYDTAGPDNEGGQIVEITVVRDQLEAAEEKRNPISGTATMGVSNRGSMMGLSLAYDGTKPRGALIMTNMEIRIRDRASGKALYEARARIATREGTKAAGDDAVSVRLAGALFERFPSSSLAAR